MFRVLAIASLVQAAIVVKANVREGCLNPYFRLESFAEGQGCGSGDNQSPINIPADATPLGDACAVIQEPIASSVVLQNKGTALQAGWRRFKNGARATFPRMGVNGEGIADILVNGGEPTAFVRCQPLQFHFHSLSEHALEGLYAAAETHIVGLVAEGDAPDGWPCDTAWNGGEITDEIIEKCACVVGTLYKTAATSPPWFSDAFATADTECGSEVSWRREFDMDLLLPDNLAHKEYLGSLTTPGDFPGGERCNEGIRWIVFDELKELSADTLRDMQQWMGNTYEPGSEDEKNIYLSNRRPTQPLNGRTVYQCTNEQSSP